MNIEHRTSNGRFYTMDSKSSVARAVAIKDGRFLAVGGGSYGWGSGRPRHPAAGFNPFVALYSLVTRKNNLGRDVAPQEAVTREEALRSYTTNGTWLTREENIKGTIEAGKVADMVVLDRDYFAVPKEEIKDTQVEKTMVAGNIVWDRE